MVPNNGGMGERPDRGLVEQSRRALARIDSEVSLMLKAIAALPAPADMNMVQWEVARAAMEAEAKKNAEKQKLTYKSVIQLDELHQIYENVINETKAANQTEMPVEEDTKSPVEEAEKKISAALQEAFLREGLKLDLSGLLLDNLPSSLMSLRSTLVKLDLSNNDLECLPESVTSMVNLVSLDVHSNQLKSLPDSIGRLVNLKVLNVSGNSLAVFPEGLSNCSALEELSANFNRLMRLPESLGFKLTTLRKFSVHSNKISYLPDSICCLMSLRVLDVHLNKLSSLPVNIDKLIRLETLNVSKNFQFLVGLPESIGRLNSLKELDVSYNQITVLPDSIGELEKLQDLSLEGNPLIVPPLEVVEYGLEAVKHYMRERLKAGTIGSKRITGHGTSWLRQLLAGRRPRYGKEEGSVNLLSEGVLSCDEDQT